MAPSLKHSPPISASIVAILKLFDDEGLSGEELKQAQQKWEEVLSALKEDLVEKFDHATARVD